MRHLQIESWVLRVLDQITAGQPIEDQRVEVKAEWPRDAARTARRVAGHANAAQGDPILWIIGVDERNRRITGAPVEELSMWLPPITAQFDGVAPEVISLNVKYEQTVVVALVFDTTRAPYVVKNPAFGSQPGEAVELEVPWRDGNRVRTARREDLIRIIGPLQAVPEFELLQGRLVVVRDAGGSVTWSLDAWYYADYVPLNSTGPLSIPLHRSTIWCTAFSGQDPHEIAVQQFVVDERARGMQVRSLSPLIQAGPAGLVIEGSGRFRVVARDDSIAPDGPPLPMARISLRCAPSRGSHDIVAHTELPLIYSQEARWDWGINVTA